MTITWGKYKGQQLSDMPLSYLNWVIANVHQGCPIRAKCEEELNKRKNYGFVN